MGVGIPKASRMIREMKHSLAVFYRELAITLASEIISRFQIKDSQVRGVAFFG